MNEHSNVTKMNEHSNVTKMNEHSNVTTFVHALLHIIYQRLISEEY